MDEVRSVGFQVSLFSFEEFQSGVFEPRPALPAGGKVIYRGWMISAAEYQNLEAAILQRGSKLMIDTEMYLASHYLPNWYKLISHLTPETRVFPADCDLKNALLTLDWPEYFIKDYVKSLKTSVGSRISKPEQVPLVVAAMRQYRGTVEVGFCVRRVEPFLPATEQRFFVLNGIPHANKGDVPSIVLECAKRLPSTFYSVDVIQRADDGNYRIVEVGDGQVSDLVGWSPKRFASVLHAGIFPQL